MVLALMHLRFKRENTDMSPCTDNTVRLSVQIFTFAELRAVFTMVNATFSVLAHLSRRLTRL